MISEQAVALTDFALAIECAAFALVTSSIGRGGARDHRQERWFALFFAATSAAAVLGGAFHGFTDHCDSAAGRVVWEATLLAIGLGAVASWCAGAHLLVDGSARRRLVTIACSGFLFYAAAIVASGTCSFEIAVAFYVPATLFLLIAFIVAWLRTNDRAAVAAAVGLGLTLAGSALQQTGAVADSRWLDHNTAFHLIQALALALVFVGVRACLRTRF